MALKSRGGGCLSEEAPVEYNCDSRGSDNMEGDSLSGGRLEISCLKEERRLIGNFRIFGKVSRMAQVGD